MRRIRPRRSGGGDLDSANHAFRSAAGERMRDIPLTVTPASPTDDLISWQPVPGVGSYRLMRDGKWISSSYDGAKTTWRVRRGQAYLVRAFGGVIAEGIYPSVVPPSGVPFGSRPNQATRVTRRFLTDPAPIENLTFRTTVGRAATFEGCKGLGYLRMADFDHAWNGIDILSCEDFTLIIEDCRYLNWQSDGSDWPITNFVQYDKCFGLNIVLRRCDGKGGRTEDIVSVDHSGGPSRATALLVEDNRFEGTDWISGSGSGVMIDPADDRGWAIVRRNKLLNPGQVGIGAHGPRTVITENDLYCDGKMIPGRVIIREGIDVGDHRSVGCEVSHNRVDWKNSNGDYAPFTLDTNPDPVGWDTNNFGWRATAAELAAMRPVL